MISEHTFSRAPLRTFADPDLDAATMAQLAMMDKALLATQRAQLFWRPPYPGVGGHTGGPGASGGMDLIPPTGLPPANVAQLYAMNGSTIRAGSSPPVSVSSHLWNQWTALHGLNFLIPSHSQMIPPGYSADNLRFSRPMIPGLNLNRYAPYLQPKRVTSPSSMRPTNEIVTADTAS